MIIYPIINFKDTLPWSLMLIVSLYLLRDSLSFPRQLRPIAMLLLFNYLPYWISDSRGRYIIPLYPFLAVLFSFYIYRANLEKGFKKFMVGALLITIVLRSLYGLFYFPYMEKRENSEKRIAMSIIEAVSLEKDIACECPEKKSVCLYISIKKGKPLKRLNKNPDASYVIACNKTFGETIKEYKLNGKSISLQTLNN